jgi:hypothetical protein
MESAADQLITVRRDYIRAYEKWKQVLAHLEQFSQANSQIPSPVLSQDRHRATYQWTDVKTFCHFTFADETGILIFGFTHQLVDGEEADVITARLVFDQHGNVRESLNAPGSRWILTESSDFDGFFFPRLLEAQRQAFAEKLENVPTTT